MDVISKKLSYTTNILTRSINNSEISTNNRLQTLESSLQASIAGVQQKLNATSSSSKYNILTLFSLRTNFTGTNFNAPDAHFEMKCVVSDTQVKILEKAIYI